jgi:Cu(I)/Ag(I) efflux system membrane fusion protein
VDFIEPFYGGNADLPGFRVYLPNPDGQLRIGNLVRGTVQAAKIEGLWLPRSAVVDLGERQVVYRQADEAFRPVAVTTGQRTGDWVEIISGVTEQDQVAEDAQFMVGSESFIKVQEQDDE